MKLIVVCLIALIVSIGLGVLAVNDHGYVVLSRDPYQVRMPLLFLILIVLVAFVVLYVLLNILFGIVQAPKQFANLKQQMDENAAHKNCMQGFTGLIEGQWAHAEDRLLKKVANSRMPLIHYLGAAYAALQQGNLRHRDQYLDRALKHQPEQSLSIQLTRARFHCHAGEYVEARKVLESLSIENPKNKALLRLLADVYQALEDWNALTGILPKIKKLKVLPVEEIEKREQLTWDRLLTANATKQSELEGPVNWSSLPNKQKKNPAIIAAMAKQLMNRGEAKKAETFLRRALNKRYDPKLVNLYGQVQSPFIPYQIELVERLLKVHPSDPELLFALARLHRYQGDHNRSKSLYEKVMSFNKNRNKNNEVYTDLAALYEQMGDSDAALNLYKEGVKALEGRSLEISDESNPSAKSLLAQDSDSDPQSALPVVR